ncbi:DMT family transporter [Leptospira mayottensis]|uniref:EamA-like transporter family protein n=2 Tax=Leptospira mayottensis TaxID=1137606 RepID=A0AA87MNR2_9LEPT|nr:DMT family transporter [Leptospira mayottensis]AXR59688.1 DMT family transporter [Leptospira mayottensis]AXR63473.1 DMT family transporter [Leptospira mayottensis]AZQ00990.1 EamA/RhaT family transporter [Leptospira mayottensis 200901116]EKR98993.1 EamA-like transporter family protein [Leptospira mayottensis 200901122]TGN01752.1 DMT family transporter [Leptospira mayottensis]
MFRIGQFGNEVYLILCTLVWGGTFTMTVFGLRDTSPSIFLSLRFGIASFVFFPFVWKEFRSGKVWYPSAFWLGMFLYLGFACETLGLKTTTATKSSFLIGTLVVITPFLEAVFKRKMPARGNLLGAAVVFTGICLILLGEIGMEGSLMITSGDWITLGGAFFFSLYIIQMDRVGSEIPIRVSIFYQSFVAGFLALVSTIGLHFTGIEEARINPSMGLIPGVLYNALLASVLTTFLQTKFQRYVSPTRVGIIFSLEPVFSSIIAFLLLGETSGPIRIAGCTIVFAGLILAELIGKDREADF